MALFNRRSREPTAQPNAKSVFQMVTAYGEYFYAWGGKIYKSDIVRACMRPYVQAVGKLTAKHVLENANGLRESPRQYMALLLKYPNRAMTAQMFQEKMAAQLLLNNNAFALIERDAAGLPCGLYPIPCTSAQMITDRPGEPLAIRFTYRNGSTNVFWYSDILHLRRDFCEDDYFGTSPGAALAQLMDCISVADQSLVKAIKNSSIIRWLLRFNQSIRPEDIKKNTQEFVNTYLTYESESFGAAGIDAKVDAQQIEPKDYVPNSAVSAKLVDRLYSFFNTNADIVQSKYTEDEWNAYYEAEIEPFAIQYAETLTERLFSRKEIAFGNKIVVEASSLQYSSMSTKLSLVQFLDRGIMNANEIRAVMNLPPIDGGDEYVRRLDTVPIDKDGGSDE